MSTTLVTGTIISDQSGNPQLSIGGVQQGAFWSNGVSVNIGDSVICGIYQPQETGAPFIYVLGATATGPTPLGGITGTVAAVVGGSQTITVTINSVNTTCAFLSSYAPTVGDNVAVLWQDIETVPTVLGKIGTVRAAAPPPPPPPPPNPAPPPAPPPAPVQHGNKKFPATYSATWQGVWDPYYGQNVYTGSGWSPTDTGSWWYSGATRQLAGRTINAFAFRLGARRAAGNYNQDVNIHFYRTSNNYQGGSDSSRVEGPYTVTVAAHFGGGWIGLPTDWGQHLADSGGGISIAGEPYAGFTGVGEDPESGQLSFDWTRS